MKALFVSHGSPMILVEPSPARDFLSGLGGSLPRPSAVLVVSAHWDAAAPMVSTAARPATIHDFGGFPPELHRFRYDTPGAPDLARRVAALTGAHLVERGLDHGAWVPLLLAWPDGVPVTQLSIRMDGGPAHHHALGRALAPLAGDGVLILASGAATHNLRAYFRDEPGGAGRSRAFTDWLAEKVAAGAEDELLAYRSRAPEAEWAHPTDEHLLPLFVALGVGGGPGRVLHRSLDGSLAMDAHGWG